MSGPKPGALLMPACQGYQMRRGQHSQFPWLSLHSQSVHSEANDSLRLAHSLPPQLKLCTLLSAPTEFTSCSTPKPKLHRMWYDCFRRNRMSAESVHLSIFGAETEPKPKFSRPLVVEFCRRRGLSDSISSGATTGFCYSAVGHRVCSFNEL